MPVNEESNDEDPNNGDVPSESPITQNEPNTTQHDDEVHRDGTSRHTEVTIDESSRLRELQADIRDQDDLERDIGRQVDLSCFSHLSNHGD
jgi:DNA excision repair protein ERCC-6